jgi:hypothetical protein
VQCFFTCTPREIMAGASVSLWGEFCGISAGLDVYVDVLIKWDPFYLLARMGVCVWFEFLGRHEIGVDLTIHTPPFGGEATIDLFIVSFTIEFGDNDPPDDRLPVPEFVKSQLRLTPHGQAPVSVPTLSTASEPGLMRVDVGWGRTVEKGESKDDDAQEGLTPATAIPVQVEFGLVVKSRMPLINAALDGSKADVWFTGVLDLPLCRDMDNASHVRITVQGPAGIIATAAGKPPTAVRRKFPGALYGELVPDGNWDNRGQAVSEASNAQRTIEAAGTYTLEYDADPLPAGTALINDNQPEVETEKRYFYPLPLTSTNVGILARRTTLATLARKLSFGRVRARRATAAHPVISAAAAAAVAASSQRPVREVAVPHVREARVATTGRAAPSPSIAGMPAGVPVIAVPSSPVRRAELADVLLQIMPRKVRSQPIAPRHEPATTRLQASARRRPAPAAQHRDLKQGLSVAPGKAVHIELTDERSVQGSVAFEAQAHQSVRSIFLGGGGKPLADRRHQGASHVAIPAGARRLVLIGEEPGQPTGAMGIERSTLALALEGQSFAAAGCVIDVHSLLPTVPPPLSALTGEELLRAARHLVAHFPALAVGAAVAFVRVVSPTAAPASEQVRWRARDATLGPVHAVTRGTQVAVIVPVAAAGDWTLEVDIGRDYRLDGLVALDHTADALARELAVAPSWTLLDGQWSPVASHPAVAATLVARPGAAPIAPAAGPKSDSALIARVEIVR